MSLEDQFPFKTGFKWVTPLRQGVARGRLASSMQGLQNQPKKMLAKISQKYWTKFRLKGT